MQPVHVADAPLPAADVDVGFIRVEYAGFDPHRIADLEDAAGVGLILAGAFEWIFHGSLLSL